MLRYPDKAIRKRLFHDGQVIDGICRVSVSWGRNGSSFRQPEMQMWAQWLALHFEQRRNLYFTLALSCWRWSSPCGGCLGGHNYRGSLEGATSCRWEHQIHGGWVFCLFPYVAPKLWSSVISAFQFVFLVLREGSASASAFLRPSPTLRRRMDWDLQGHPL